MLKSLETLHVGIEEFKIMEKTNSKELEIAPTYLEKLLSFKSAKSIKNLIFQRSDRKINFLSTQRAIPLKI